MFNLGIQELTLIFIIALLFIGPKQLPGLARSLGKMVRDFKRATNEITDSFQREAKQFNDFQDDIKKDIEREINLIPETSSVATKTNNNNTVAEEDKTTPATKEEPSDDKA